MHNEDDNLDLPGIRREILGDIATDLIDEAARRRIASVPEEQIEDFRNFIEEADGQQMYLLNLSQMFMEVGLASNEPRLAYASCAVMALSGALDGVIPEGDWETVMRYAEHAWEEAKGLVDEVVSEQVDKLIED